MSKAKSTATREKETRQAKFLSGLMLGQSVAEAAAFAGVNRRTVYDWKDQSQSFANAWEETIAERQENLLARAEDVLKQRALDPSDPRSYILLIFLLKKLDPTYKENYKNETKIIHETVHEIDFSMDDIKTAQDILDKARTQKPQQPQEE